MRKPLIFVIIIILSFFASCDRKTEREKQLGDIYVPVKIKIVEPTDVERTINFSGILSPIQQAQIGPQFSAWVKSLFVKEGDFVRKGQLLVVLDDAQARQASAQFEATRKEYERVKALFDSGVATKQQLDQVEAAYLAAKAGNELVLSNTRIYAPYDGVIADVNVEIGEAFSPMSMTLGGKPSILSVLKVDSMKVEIRVPATRLPFLKIGQHARILVDAYADSVFWGNIINIEPTADRATGTFKTVIAITNKNRILKTGMFARVFAIVETRENAITVDQNSVISDSMVFVAKGGKAISRRISIAFQTAQSVVVDSGLNIGDSVIVGGVVGLFDGAQIRIVDY